MTNLFIPFVVMLLIMIFHGLLKITSTALGGQDVLGKVLFSTLHISFICGAKLLITRDGGREGQRDRGGREG